MSYDEIYRFFQVYCRNVVNQKIAINLLNVESDFLPKKSQIACSVSIPYKNKCQREKLNNLPLKSIQTDSGVNGKIEIVKKLLENIDNSKKMNAASKISVVESESYINSASTDLNNNEKSIDVTIKRCNDCNAGIIVSDASKKQTCWKCIEKCTFEMHLNQTKKIKCRLCGSKTLWDGMDAHILLVHHKLMKIRPVKDYELVSLELFKCKRCNAVPITEDNLMKHQKINHAEIPFDENNFELFGVENKPTFVKCTKCQKIVKQTEFGAHKKRACGIKIADTKEISTITLNETKSKNYYLCEECQCVMGEKTLEKHHLKMHKKIPYEESLYMIKSFIGEMCPICGEYYKLNEFESHAEIKHPTILVNHKQSMVKLCSKDANNELSKVTAKQKVAAGQGVSF